MEAFRFHLKDLLRISGLVIVLAVSFYLVFVYVTTWLQGRAGDLSVGGGLGVSGGSVHDQGDRPRPVPMAKKPMQGRQGPKRSAIS